MLVELSEQDIETIRGELEGGRRNIEEFQCLWKPTSNTFERYQLEIDAIDAALAALDRQQGAKEVWTPVNTYINQEIFDFKAGGSKVVNTNIQGRMITLFDDSGCELSTVLRPNHAVCRLSPRPTPHAAN